MILDCGDIAMAIVDQRFAKTPRPTGPEGPFAISAGRSDFRRDDSLRSSHRAHADNLQARSRFVAIPRVEPASPPRARQARAPMQMPTTPAPPEEERSARLSRRTASALIRL